MCANHFGKRYTIVEQGGRFTEVENLFMMNDPIFGNCSNIVKFYYKGNP